MNKKLYRNNDTVTPFTAGWLHKTDLICSIDTETSADYKTQGLGLNFTLFNLDPAGHILILHRFTSRRNQLVSMVGVRWGRQYKGFCLLPRRFPYLMAAMPISYLNVLISDV